MEHKEGTVTISIKRFKELELFEEVAKKGMISTIEHYMQSYKYTYYYSKDEAITKLLNKISDLECRKRDLTSLINKQNYELSEFRKLKQMSVREFKRYKKNNR